MTQKTIRVISILEEHFLGHPHGGERREDSITVDCSDCSDTPGVVREITLPLWREMHENCGYTPERVVIGGNTILVLNAYSTYYYEDMPFSINTSVDLCADPSPVIEVYYKRWDGGFYNLSVNIGWAFQLPPMNIQNPGFTMETYIQVTRDGNPIIRGPLTREVFKVRRGSTSVIKAAGRIVIGQKFGFSGDCKRFDTLGDTFTEIRLENIKGNVMIAIPAEMW